MARATPDGYSECGHKSLSAEASREKEKRKIEKRGRTGDHGKEESEA